MIISIIVAMDNKGVIGKDNQLPWRLSADLKNFKTITMGKPIVMGRKTHESIGRPLPGRENIVLTRDDNYQTEGCTVLNTLENVLEHCKEADEIMIMGGADLYKQVLDKASKIYLTQVHADCEGNIFFPLFDRSEYEETYRKDCKADDKNEYDYSFIELVKL